MTERWEKMVENERLAATVGAPPTKVLRCDDAVKLLARQHRGMVRMVKAQIPPACMRIGYKHGYQDAQRDILAALAKQGASKKKDEPHGAGGVAGCYFAVVLGSIPGLPTKECVWKRVRGSMMMGMITTKQPAGRRSRSLMGG